MGAFRFPQVPILKITLAQSRDPHGARCPAMRKWQPATQPAGLTSARAECPSFSGQNGCGQGLLWVHCVPKMFPSIEEQVFSQVFVPDNRSTELRFPCVTLGGLWLLSRVLCNAPGPRVPGLRAHQQPVLKSGPKLGKRRLHFGKCRCNSVLYKCMHCTGHVCKEVHRAHWFLSNWQHCGGTPMRRGRSPQHQAVCVWK